MRVRLPRRSLTLSAVALMTATIATNALGLVYWAVAAHLRPPMVVGRAAAAIAALTLLSTIAQLNLTNVFLRLLPTAGHLGRRLVGCGYFAVAVLSIVAGGAYLLTGLGDGIIGSGWVARVSFLLAVLVLALFALQDSVLTALRLAPWVTLENVSFATAKIVLLPLLLVVPVSGAIAVAWLLPAGVAVLAVSVLLFGRVIPRLQANEGTLPPRRRLASFIAGEYAGNLCANAGLQLMPLLVVWQLGSAQLAYFTLPWLISMGITVLIWNVGAPFLVEMTGRHSDPHALFVRALRLWGLVVLGAMLVCVIGAEPLLQLAGGRYAAHGTGLLRLIGASAPFTAVIVVYSTLAWLDQRVWFLALLQGVSAVALLGITLLLLPSLGLIAVGWANLGVQAIGAAVAAPLAMRRIARGSLVPA